MPTRRYTWLGLGLGFNPNPNPNPSPNPNPNPNRNPYPYRNPGRNQVHYLCTYCAALPQLDDAAVSIALELLVMCTREYRLLQTPPNLLAASCLGLAVWNRPASAACSHEWDASMASYTGFGAAALVACCEAELHMLRDKHVSCRSIALGLRARSIHATIMLMDLPTFSGGTRQAVR